MTVLKVIGLVVLVGGLALLAYETYRAEKREYDDWDGHD